jgi:hypothetical protein
MTLRQQRPTFMTPTELTAAGHSVHGHRWRAPLARDIGVSARMIRYYETGEQPIPARRAAQIRKLADIGPIGLVIRGSVGKTAPDLPLNRRHKIARQILADLSAAGVLPDKPCD